MSLGKRVPVRTGVRLLRVRPRPGSRSYAVLLAGHLELPCMVGPAGFSRGKREGDGATPVGCFPVLSGFYRADRLPRPRSRVSLRATRPDDGWCDDPASTRYNKPVRLPFGARCETMWRSDRLYDIGLVLDYNQLRPKKGRGSAIFVHVMAPDATPTAGCIAVRPGDLRRLLPRLGPGCRVAIG